jgi:Metallo-beta-lactamase superfamily
VVIAVAWQLEIHHIDVQMTGDATLVIAREVNIVGPLRVRSILIDGGRAAQMVAIDAYIAQQLGANRLSGIIVTHYQHDHVGGIMRLLKRTTTRYADVRIYDQGWPAGNFDPVYTRYFRAINGRSDDGGQIAAMYRANRNRVTFQVRSDPGIPNLGFVGLIGPPAVPGAAANINQAANWLLTGAAPAEILWAGVAGGVPAGAPTMRFIAANRFVRTFAGGITASIPGYGNDPDNEKSLGVEVRFNNFRYYVAGDIETNQETAIGALLNNANNAAGRVLAVKASHHGSNSATARAFVNRLRPEAAFISCGTSNAHYHPAQETINVLDGFAANPNGANPVPAHAAVPPAPPNRPVSHYLTGYQVPNRPPPLPQPAPLSYAGDDGVTAGDPQTLPAATPGHIVVTVTAAQSNTNVLGGLYLGVQAAASTAATTAGVPGVMAVGPAGAAANAAAAAALSSGAAPAASAFLTNAGLAPAVALASSAAAAAAATNAINNAATGAATATAVTNAAMGAGAAAGPSAGAGAAAGVVVGGIDGPTLLAAVVAAVTAAGAALAAPAAGLLAAGQAVGAGGQFTVTYTDLNGAGNVIHA